MITIQTATALDTLARKIWNPADGTGYHAQDDGIDAELAALITEPMKVIDGRDLAKGFEYTLNITNALQLRAKHWYINLTEMQPPPLSLWPSITSFNLGMSPGPGVMPGPNSFGYSIGLSTCAAICYTWEKIIQLWVEGQYPFGVTQPDGLIPAGYKWMPLTEGGLAIRSGFAYNPGEIFTVVSLSPTNGMDMVATKFFADPTEQFPVNDPVAVNQVTYFNMMDLIGIEPL